ncbi:hypothetical protein PLEOSDRAFT_1031457 [Pleurotus ostreatus PC15]|uniref:ribonuclease H n=1 Tax=Pleurotus ostreatus (strain PC15) TaxID=1137138 RepID=A0A067P7V6_PLEO1|nr:hypothetical protein PLEOSDRAFT_1031457 [Pleurotus ostreatus PC15]
MNVSKATARDMPLWYHAEASQRISLLVKSNTAECLRTNHKILTVGDAMDFEEKGKIQNHKPRQNCRCHNCKYIRDHTGCVNPHVCYKKAGELLGMLPEKWDPRRIRAAQEANDNDENWHEFKTSRMSANELKDIFRIFTSGEKCLISRDDLMVQGEQVELATDGSCRDMNTTEAKAGAGIFLGVNDIRNKALRVPGELPQTNQVGEMFAVLQAARQFPGNETLKILTDSKYVIKSLTTNLKGNEDKGYIGIANKTLLRATTATLRERTGRTLFKWVKGHQGNNLNEGADLLAGQGTEKEFTEALNLEVNVNDCMSGAKLQALTQATAYRGIRETKLAKAKHR